MPIDAGSEEAKSYFSHVDYWEEGARIPAVKAIKCGVRAIDSVLAFLRIAASKNQSSESLSFKTRKQQFT
jgi:hypothetical protein